MRKELIHNAALEVATQVREVEHCIDAALTEIAELQARIMRANAVARTGVATANCAIQELVSATQGLVSARGSIAGCHSALVEAKQFVPGLRTISWGDGEDCPPDTASLPHLRIVG
jgi:hypothetical protein